MKSFEIIEKTLEYLSASLGSAGLKARLGPTRLGSRLDSARGLLGTSSSSELDSAHFGWVRGLALSSLGFTRLSLGLGLCSAWPIAILH